MQGEVDTVQGEVDTAMSRLDRLARSYAVALSLARAARAAGDIAGYQVMRAECRRLRAAMMEG